MLNVFHNIDIILKHMCFITKKYIFVLVGLLLISDLMYPIYGVIGIKRISMIIISFKFTKIKMSEPYIKAHTSYLAHRGCIISFLVA